MDKPAARARTRPPTPTTNPGNRALAFALVVVVGALLAGCVDQVPALSSPLSTLPPPATVEPLTGTLTLGAPRALVDGTSERDAETLIAAPEGATLAGFALRVPGNAYVDPTPFTVSIRSIDATSYGPLVTPASPLFTVENGGAYAAAPIAVTVPVSLPAGSFALGFYYEDGTLEAMPLLSEDSGSVTVLTRHFSSFFISTIAENALPSDIGTGFRAGEDDFPTPNYGTYVRPDGACAGQSLAELWYFSEMRTGGEPPLWRVGDNNGAGIATPDFWQDDAGAYRLASSVQADLDWNTLSETISFAFEKHGPDRLTYDAFRYAMLVTGLPQFVGLSVGTKNGGHAIVAYASTPSGLWVADPNFPGQLRQIGWDEAAGAFKPYASGADATVAHGGETAYDRVGFYAKTALVDWGMIGSRWVEALNGRVGSDRFPGYNLYGELPLPDGTGQVPESLSAGLTVAASSVTIGLISPDPDVPLRATVYRGTASMGTFAAGEEPSVPLRAGANELGFFVEGQSGGKWRALDFVRYTVSAPSSAPSAIPSASATEPPAPAATPVVTPGPRITDDPNAKGSWNVTGNPIGSPVSSGSPRFSASFASNEPGSLFGVRVYGTDSNGVAYSIGVMIPSPFNPGTGDFGGTEVEIARLAPKDGPVGVDVSLSALPSQASLDELASRGRWVSVSGGDGTTTTDSFHSLVFGHGAQGETRTLAMSVTVTGDGGTITLPLSYTYMWYDEGVGG